MSVDSAEPTGSQTGQNRRSTRGASVAKLPDKPRVHSHYHITTHKRFKDSKRFKSFAGDKSRSPISMGWFWADADPPRTVPSRISGKHERQLPGPASSIASTSRAEPPPACPMHRTETSQDRINPLNSMPFLTQQRSTRQTRELPTERTTSTIPRGDAQTNWEYPSPQQMYNAMLRKGYDNTDEEAIESMVEVHNFLNEGAWREIEGWESRFAQGLLTGWAACRSGERAYENMLATGEWRSDAQPQLLRFMGRPGEMSPKARWFELLGKIHPAKFASEPPFDRHDWFVRRIRPDGQERQIRYVIDYYSAPPEPTGEPVFYLDVRPALDNPVAACERLMRWGGDVWHRASGADVRIAKNEDSEQSAARE